MPVPPYSITAADGLYYVQDGEGNNLCKEPGGCSFMWSSAEGAEIFADRKQLLDAGIVVPPWTALGQLTDTDEMAYQTLRTFGARTVEEVELELGYVPLAPSFRRLALHGKIRATGERRQNMNGWQAVTWAAAS